MSKLVDKIPVNLKIIIKFYVVLIIIPFICRLAQMFMHVGSVADVPFSVIAKAYLIGLHFDTATACYILALPLIVFSIFSFIGKKSVIFEKIMIAVMTILTSITVFACVADIPYYDQFADHLNLTALEWFKGENGFSDVFKMIFGDPKLWGFIIPLALLIYLMFIITKLIITKTSTWQSKQYLLKSVVTVMMVVFCFIGMRGYALRERPMGVYDAFYCNNSLLNQLGMNPVYCFISSYLTDVTLIDDEIAIANTRDYLELKNTNFKNPLSRKYIDESNPNKYNVVLIIMESMSAELLERNGNKENLTPYLNKLSYNSLYFNKCFSAGKHTISGIFSVLCSYLTSFQDDPTHQLNPIKSEPVLSYNCLPKILKDNGYKTFFFVPHEATWEKLDMFLLKNSFDRIFSLKDYDKGAEMSSWGVCDKYILDYSLKSIDEIAKEKEPFFATILTVSNHQPYIIPNTFVPKHKNPREAIVEFADFSLESFFNQASEKEWFDSTVFVLVADHGKDYVQSYTPPISYFHIPLIFYAPALIVPETNNNYASQIDIFPTLMDILNISFTNNTLGVDLLKEKRPFIFMSGDTEYCAIDDEWYFIGSKNMPPQLYHYQDFDHKNYAEEKPDIVNRMKICAESNFQTFNYIYKKRLQDVED